MASRVEYEIPLGKADSDPDFVEGHMSDSENSFVVFSDDDDINDIEMDQYTGSGMDQFVLPASNPSWYERFYNKRQCSKPKPSTTRSDCFKHDDFQVLHYVKGTIIDDKINYVTTTNKTSRKYVGDDDKLSKFILPDNAEKCLTPFFEKTYTYTNTNGGGSQLTANWNTQQHITSDSGSQSKFKWIFPKNPQQTSNQPKYMSNIINLKQRLTFHDIIYFITEREYDFSSREPIDVKNKIFLELNNLMETDKDAIERYIGTVSDPIDIHLTDNDIYCLYNYAKDEYNYELKMYCIGAILDIISENIAALFQLDCELCDEDKESIYILYFSESTAPHTNLVMLFDKVIDNPCDYHQLSKHLKKVLCDKSNILYSVLISWKQQYYLANNILLSELFVNSMKYYKIKNTHEFRQLDKSSKEYICNQYQKSIQNYHDKINLL